MVGNKAQKAVAAALTGMLALGSVAPAIAAVQESNGWIRLDGTYQTTYVHDKATSGVISGTKDIDGADRYDTMLDTVVYNVANGNLKKGTPVVLVSGTSYADALSAAGLAGHLHAPVVTTPADKLGEQAEKAIKYFADGSDYKVYIVGGTSAVSADVEDDVEDITKDQNDKAVTVKAVRIAGDDRTETSAQVMDWIGAYLKKYNGDSSIFIANGWAWADALSVSSFAYAEGAPLLLTNSDGTLTDAQVKILKDIMDSGVSVNVIGGPAETSVEELQALGYKKGQITYIAGDDRYDTSAQVVKVLKEEKKLNGAVAVATGKNWPDALVGGPFAAANDGILVLMGDKAGEDVAVKQAIKSKATSGLKKQFNKFIIGGKSAVTKDMANKITTL